MTAHNPRKNHRVEYSFVQTTSVNLLSQISRMTGHSNVFHKGMWTEYRGNEDTIALNRNRNREQRIENRAFENRNIWNMLIAARKYNLCSFQYVGCCGPWLSALYFQPYVRPKKFYLSLFLFLLRSLSFILLHLSAVCTMYMCMLVLRGIFHWTTHFKIELEKQTSKHIVMVFHNFISHLNRIHINSFIEGTVNTNKHVHI